MHYDMGKMLRDVPVIVPLDGQEALLLGCPFDCHLEFRHGHFLAARVQTEDGCLGPAENVWIFSATPDFAVPAISVGPLTVAMRRVVGWPFDEDLYDHEQDLSDHHQEDVPHHLE